MKKMTMFVAVALMAVFTAIAMYPGEVEKEAIRTVSLSGQVLDIVSGEGLAGVKLQVEETEDVIYTDFNGNFSIDGLVPGSYKLSATYISYRNSDINLKIEDTQNIKVKMEQIVR